jgi:hypothetical protein
VLEPLKPGIGWNERIDEDCALLEPVGGDLDVDPRVHRGPVEDTGEDLAH